MSATKPPTLEQVEPGAGCADHNPGQDSLSPVLGQQWALELRHLLLVSGFCLFFMYHNYVPLFHSDVWGHVAYGNWILDHRQLPSEEPFVALAAGVPIVDTAWLGQVLLAIAGRMGNAEWYGHLYALTVLMTYLVLARAFYLQTRRPGISAVGAFLVWGVAWSRHAIIRPEIFGSLCFALLILLVVKANQRRSRRPADFNPTFEPSRLSWTYWIGVPTLFTIWANLHGSFIVGIALLGCHAAGRMLEVLWMTPSMAAVLRDRLFRRWLILTELAVAGTLVNPYGFDLLIHTLLFSSNPNLKDVLEWFPLEMVSLEGIPMACSWVLVAVLFRHSRARVTPCDVLLLAVFNLAVCLRVRMVSWYAPVVILVLAPHLADVARRVEHALRASSLKEASSRFSTALRKRSFSYSLFAGFVVWLTFAFSPVSQPVLGGKLRPPERLYSRDTPLGATRYLHEHPPRGMVAAPQWWGDWMIWKGPDGMQVLSTTNSVHVLPAKVWQDYLAIARGAPGMERRLNRFRVNTIVVCKTLQAQLLKTVETLNGWTTVYEDKISLIVQRTQPQDETEDGDPDSKVTDTEVAHVKEAAP